MNIYVDANKVKILNKDIINSGEYNIHNCIFTFTDDYNDLEIKAVFSDKNETYETSVVNNQVTIPTEVLDTTGIVEIGVYAYTTENDKLLLRYSPKPDKFYVNKGTYKEGIAPVIDPSTTEFEQLQSRVATIENNYVNGNDVESMINEAIYGALEGVY